MRTEDDGFYRVSPADVILAVLVLAWSAFSIMPFIGRRILPPGIPQAALIYADNRLLKELDLGKDGIFPLWGGRMQIEVKGRRVRVLDSDCPQRICVHAGWIDQGGQVIACIPHHVLVEIKPAAAQTVDAVAL